MSTRAGFDWTGLLAWLIVALIFLAIAGGVFGIRLAITGGDLGCAFAQDPALCVAVKVSER